MTLVCRHGLALCAMLVACGRGGGTSNDASAARGREPDRASAPDASAAPSAAGGSAELRDPVPLKVIAEVGGKRAAYTGMGECHHTTDASIYEVPATMWSAQGQRRVGRISAT